MAKVGGILVLFYLNISWMLALDIDLGFKNNYSTADGVSITV